MNERIRQLAEQAGDYVNETYTGPVRSKTPGKIWEDGHVGWHTQFNQKFAELLIKECITIVDEQKECLHEEQQYWHDRDYGYEMAVNDASKGIKQFFGVEE